MWNAPPCPNPSVGPYEPVVGPGRARAGALRCLRQTSKKARPGKNNIPYMLKCVVLDVLVIFMELCKYGIPSRNDYHHKNCIGILNKKTCFAAPHLFSRADFLGNYWNYRTLTRMSTREYAVTVLIACPIKNCNMLINHYNPQISVTALFTR